MEKELVLGTFTTSRNFRFDSFIAYTTSTVKRVEITTTSRYEPPTSPLQFQIQFNFSRKSLYFYWVPSPNHPRGSQLDRTDDSRPPDVRSTVLPPCKLRNRSEASLLLHQLLSDWFPFLPNWGPQWIDQVLESARDGLGCMPDGHNAIVVDFHCVVHHGLLRHYLGHVFEGASNNYMVPTKESWIESLVEKTIVLGDSSGTCAVCLEDFSDDDGSEGVLMPCAHVFHRDCIGQWLRTSHYCPVCRFQLPTD